jgi:polysaccharide biosynthesis protein PslH
MSAILLLTPQVPYPPRQGTALRNWGLLRGLAAAHEISLLTFASPDQPLMLDPILLDCTVRAAVVPQPRRASMDRLRDLLTSRRPDLVQRLVSEPFREQLEAWLARYRFDWVIIEGLEMAPYLAACSDFTGRLAFDDHNCEYLLQKRAAGADWRNPRRWFGALYSSIQWRRLRRCEAAVCRRVDLVIAVSKEDAAALHALSNEVDPLVVPNGLDVEAYAAADCQAVADGSELSQPAFVFTGTMNFRPNVDGVLWFVDDVWPRIREAVPGATFYIVGRHPHARLERARAISGIVITGGVPDTRPYIAGATVCVVPLLVGGGTRLKLLESTAMGKAIVATPLAAEGFVEPERAMVLAEAPQAFADACIALARDPAARAAWGARARVYAKAYDWARLLPPLLARLA